jgi:hypothetical protein
MEKRMEEENNRDALCTRRKICVMCPDHTQRRKMSLNWAMHPDLALGPMDSRIEIAFTK